MQIVCLDLEGVLVPEIWIEFSKRTNIPELSRTTRDEPAEVVSQNARVPTVSDQQFIAADRDSVGLA